jgi:hypothetical protein
MIYVSGKHTVSLDASNSVVVLLCYRLNARFLDARQQGAHLVV